MIQQTHDTSAVFQQAVEGNKILDKITAAQEALKSTDEPQKKKDAHLKIAALYALHAEQYPTVTAETDVWLAEQHRRLAAELS